MILLHKFFKRELSAAIKSSFLHGTKKGEIVHIFLDGLDQIFNCLKNCIQCRTIVSDHGKLVPTFF